MIKPGTWCALGLFGTALAMDAVLVVNGHDTISTCVRTGRVEKAFTLYLAAHAAMSLPVDPLVMLGSVYTNTYVTKRANRKFTLPRLPIQATAPKIRPRPLRLSLGGHVV